MRIGNPVKVIPLRWILRLSKEYTAFSTDKVKKEFKVKKPEEYGQIFFDVSGVDSLAFVDLLDAQDWRSAYGTSSMAGGFLLPESR